MYLRNQNLGEAPALTGIEEARAWFNANHPPAVPRFSDAELLAITDPATRASVVDYWQNQKLSALGSMVVDDGQNITITFDEARARSWGATPAELEQARITAQNALQAARSNPIVVGLTPDQLRRLGNPFAAAAVEKAGTTTSGAAVTTAAKAAIKEAVSQAKGAPSTAVEEGAFVEALTAGRKPEEAAQLAVGRTSQDVKRIIKGETLVTDTPATSGPAAPLSAGKKTGLAIGALWLLSKIF